MDQHLGPRTTFLLKVTGVGLKTDVVLKLDNSLLMVLPIFSQSICNHIEMTILIVIFAMGYIDSLDGFFDVLSLFDYFMPLANGGFVGLLEFIVISNVFHGSIVYLWIELRYFFLGLILSLAEL